MEYHKINDPHHVKQVLGHRRIDSTILYVNIEKAVFNDAAIDGFHFKVAQKPEEIKSLLETGFEYILQKDRLAYFRRRK